MSFGDPILIFHMCSASLQVFLGSGKFYIFSPSGPQKTKKMVFFVAELWLLKVNRVQNFELVSKKDLSKK